MNKSALLEALHRFIRQRPGLEFGNYGDLSAYRSEMRSITKDRHQAESLLRYVSLRDSITAEDIIKASRDAFSGRLTIEALNDGEGFSIQYCTGQYFPTEYRRAVCAVLASAIWDRLREDMPEGIENRGDYLRATAKRELGRTIASRWLS